MNKELIRILELIGTEEQPTDGFCIAKQWGLKPLKIGERSINCRKVSCVNCALYKNSTKDPTYKVKIIQVSNLL